MTSQTSLSVISMVMVVLLAMVFGCAGPTATPIPSPTEEFEIELVPTAPSAYQLDVAPVYAGHDVCMLGSLGMIVKYADPALDFCDVVGCSGIGPTGYFIPDKPTRGKFSFANGRWAGMVFAPRHLGFSLTLGIAEGGRLIYITLLFNKP